MRLSESYKVVYAIYAALGAVICFLIFFRVGTVPAASAGDEVWWSDAGWFFQKEGVLRWGVMDDDKGSGQMSYWPPVLPIIQGAIFYFFGLSPVTICIQSAFHAAIAFCLVWLLVRQYNGSPISMIAAAAAIMAPFHLDRRLTVVRMENMTAIGALAFLWLLNKGAQSSQKFNRRIWYSASGLALSIGLLSYYPQSPMLALGAALAVASIRKWESVVFVVFGAAPLGLVALLWMLQDPELFRLQILSTGNSHYFSADNFLLPFKQLLNWNSPLLAWLALESVVCIIMGAIIIIKANNPSVRRLGFLCACMSAPPFMFTDGRPVTGLLILIVWFFSMPMTGVKRPVRSLVNSTRLILPWITFAKLSLIGFTAVYQAEGRNYQLVESALDKIDFTQGNVAISQRAWLALREKVSSDKLHFLVYSGASLLNAPVKAKSPDAEQYFSHLVLEYDKLDLLFELYPWLHSAINSGRFQVIAEIKPTFHPLPWASTPCYHLVVYSKQ